SRASASLGRVMLPLLSSRIPRLTGADSSAKYVTSRFWPSSKIVKSSFVRPDTNMPSRPVTVAVTVTTSTPEWNVESCCPPASASVATPATTQSRNHYFPRELRVVLEERLLLRQRLGLDVAVPVRRARNDGVLAGRRARPGVREVLPRVLAGRRLD